MISDFLVVGFFVLVVALFVLVPYFILRSSFRQYSGPRNFIQALILFIVVVASVSILSFLIICGFHLSGCT